MATRKPVLTDHKRVKSKLITPFNDQLGPLREVSWINTMIPELIWIALMQDRWGPHQCVELLTAFTRDVRASHADRSDTVWAALGKFEEVLGEELRAIVSNQPYRAALVDALRPLTTLYPEHPLSHAFAPERLVPNSTDIDLMKRIVTDLYDRSSIFATMTQAHAVWLAFDAGRLKVSPTVALADFPRIDEYPKTDLSRRIASGIRAMLNGSFGPEGLMGSRSDWPVQFWNRGLQLEPCEDADGNRV